jgi:hypothetical protein
MRGMHSGAAQLDVGPARQTGRMTRFGIDAYVAIRLAREQLVVPAQHQLVAPSVLRSHALHLVYRSYRSHEVDSAEARLILDAITTMNIRLLGDRVSRGRAWRLAEENNWADTTAAEYLSVAQLQADVLVALDPEVARLAVGLVEIAPFEALATS